MKEFDGRSKIGFGINGKQGERNKDFEAVRGTYRGNKFVKQIEKDSKEAEERAAKMLSLLEKIQSLS